MQSEMSALPMSALPMPGKTEFQTGLLRASGLLLDGDGGALSMQQSERSSRFSFSSSIVKPECR